MKPSVETVDVPVFEDFEITCKSSRRITVIYPVSYVCTPSSVVARAWEWLVDGIRGCTCTILKLPRMRLPPTRVYEYFNSPRNSVNLETGAADRSERETGRKTGQSQPEVRWFAVKSIPFPGGPQYLGPIQGYLFPFTSLETCIDSVRWKATAREAFLFGPGVASGVKVEYKRSHSESETLRIDRGGSIASRFLRPVEIRRFLSNGWYAKIALAYDARYTR